MAIDLYRYGDTDPIYFKLTLNGAGVATTLASADVKLYKDGTYSADIGTACTSLGAGLYKWTPAAGSNTQCKVMILNIKDASGGPLFDENCLIITTGGSASAGLD
jgi:hypothetical protein